MDNNKFDIYKWMDANKEAVECYEEDFGINGHDMLTACQSLSEVKALLGSYLEG